MVGLWSRVGWVIYSHMLRHWFSWLSSMSVDLTLCKACEGGLGIL